jgi:hypothetical protein
MKLQTRLANSIGLVLAVIALLLIAAWVVSMLLG